MNLIMARVTDSVQEQGRALGRVHREGSALRRMQECEVRRVEKRRRARGARGTEYTAALAAVVPAFAERERGTTYEGVAVCSLRVGLPEVAGKEHS